MATTEFIGVVRGYSEGDDGMVHLSIDELNHSEEADWYVKDMQRAFNPTSGSHGFGSRDIPCKIKPGFAGYKFTLSPDEAHHISHGSRVRVKMDVYNVRKVIFHNRRWAPIPEIRYSLVDIRPESEPRIPDHRPTPDQRPASEQPQSGKQGKDNK